MSVRTVFKIAECTEGQPTRSAQNPNLVKFLGVLLNQMGSEASSKPARSQKPKAKCRQASNQAGEQGGMHANGQQHAIITMAARPKVSKGILESSLESKGANASHDSIEHVECVKECVTQSQCESGQDLVSRQVENYYHYSY
ncbi:hypothetical protein TCAL_04125 [Tigriopus californicus]|uniref:Uncharacterized protein n=1 Tax=Tigriopus californicus TaxID=6832 RepID=A0A553NSF5_TIGCA|nr:hypothetical protein TCAL_04125 [Tigriopus californicus]